MGKRGDNFRYLRIPGSLGYVDAGNLVIETAVSTIGGKIFVHCIDDLDPCGSTGAQQLRLIGQHRRHKEIDEIRVLGLLLSFVESSEGAPSRMRAVVLHVDEQQCRVRWVDRKIASELVRHQAALTNRLPHNASKRSPRSAHEPRSLPTSSNVDRHRGIPGPTIRTPSHRPLAGPALPPGN